MWDVELLAWCLLSKTVRPWHRIISVQLLHNCFVICYVIERHLHLAIVPAASKNDVTSGHVTIVSLLELKSEDETVRFCTTPTSAIVFARGKMNIFDFFAIAKTENPLMDDV